jgi:hypothetical protein
VKVFAWLKSHWQLLLLCTCFVWWQVVTIDGFHDVPEGDEAALLKAVAHQVRVSSTVGISLPMAQTPQYSSLRPCVTCTRSPSAALVVLNITTYLCFLLHAAGCGGCGG